MLLDTSVRGQTFIEDFGLLPSDPGQLQRSVQDRNRYELPKTTSWRPSI
jgi:hypothetical protein